jgi:hypothetical protein
MQKVKVLAFREATLRGWRDRVGQRSTVRSKRHGTVYQDAIGHRMGCSSVSEVAFREFYPNSAIPYIDESQVGKHSIGNGAGTPTFDWVLNRSHRPMLGGGVVGQCKMAGPDSTEVTLCTGNLSTIFSVLDAWHNHWMPNGIKFVLVLADADAPGDPRNVKVERFAMFDLMPIVRGNPKYANEAYKDYTWSPAGVHVRDPSVKGRGLAAKSPLRVVWTTRNKSQRKYAKLVLSLTHADVASRIRWVDTSDLTHGEAADLMAATMMRVGR